MIYEGWYVDYLVEGSGSRSTLWLKLWEYGEDEPTWDDVKAQPPFPHRPGDEIW